MSFDIDPRLKYGMALPLVGGPLIAAGIFHGDTPRVNAELVSSGTAIELCGPTQWREPARTGYPVPFGGMRQGDKYVLNDTLAAWDASVIIGDRIKAGNIDEKYVSPQNVKITIFHPNKGGGPFTAEFNAGNNIRYDLFTDNKDVIWDKRSQDKILTGAIERARTFQSAVSFDVLEYDVTTGNIGVYKRLSAAEADTFIQAQKKEETNLCTPPTSTNTSTTTSTSTPTTTPKAVLSATPTSTETALSTLTATATPTATTAKPTPQISRMNCGLEDMTFLSNGDIYAPNIESFGGGSYPPGPLGTMVEVPVMTPPLNDTLIVTPRMDYKVAGGVGQWYQSEANKFDGFTVALFPGGEFGTNWVVRLPANEAFQAVIPNPAVGWTPQVMKILENRGIFFAYESRRREGLLPPNFIQLVRLNSGGSIDSTPLVGADIARRVRFSNCIGAAIVPTNFMNRGW